MKNSPNLDKFRRSRFNRHFLSVLVRKNADGSTPEPSQWHPNEIIIGGIYDGDITGAYLNSILCGRYQKYSYMNLRPDNFADITEQFWPEYERIGRCAFDHAHTGFFLNDEDRFTIAGDERTCNWCGAQHTRHVEERTEIRRIETWRPVAPAQA